MPKELTHWMLAEKSLEQLESTGALHELIVAHRNLYLAGAVLPDTLLHLFYGPWSKQALMLACQFHDTAGNSFMPLIEAEKSFPTGCLPRSWPACWGSSAIYRPMLFCIPLSMQKAVLRIWGATTMLKPP